MIQLRTYVSELGDRDGIQAAEKARKALAELRARKRYLVGARVEVASSTLIVDLRIAEVRQFVVTQKGTEAITYVITRSGLDLARTRLQGTRTEKNFRNRIPAGREDEYDQRVEIVGRRPKPWEFVEWWGDDLPELEKKKAPTGMPWQ